MNDQEHLEEMLAEVDASRQEGAMVGAFHRGVKGQGVDSEAALSLTFKYMDGLFGEEDEEGDAP